MGDGRGKQFELEKWEWDEIDFEKMGWHDCHIHSIAFFPDQYEIAFDIDYIFKWVHPKGDETNFKFWISPATLVFQNVYDMDFDIQTSGGLEIDTITRDNQKTPRNVEFLDKNTEWQWNIECHEGVISFVSIGYSMHVRKPPILSSKQILDRKERGGISFERKTSTKL